MRFAVPVFLCLLLTRPLALPAYQFRSGERIRFKINVFGIHVGYQDMIFKGKRTLNGKNVLYAIADTRSLPSIKKMFNYSLHDVMHVWMDPDTLLPLLVRKDIQEGSWQNKVTITIDQKKRTALYRDKRNRKGRIIRLKRPTLDILSMIYYIRSQKPKPGRTLEIDYLVDKKNGVQQTSLLVRRAKPITIGGKAIPTIYYEQKGGHGVKVRMTDDAHRIPLNISVATFKVHGYSIDIVGRLLYIR